MRKDVYGGRFGVLEEILGGWGIRDSLVDFRDVGGVRGGMRGGRMSG